MFQHPHSILVIASSKMKQQRGMRLKIGRLREPLFDNVNG